MSPNYKPVPLAPMIRGLIASTDYATQPKGSCPRLSNFLLNKRGALDVCDGTQLLHAFNGQVQQNLGKCMESFFFQPTGVASYYLALFKVTSLSFPLGAPLHVTIADGGAGGSLSGSYFYVITAIDGVGGETTPSAEVTIVVAAGHKITLTWNVVPNAQGYRVYRSTTTGTEVLLSGSDLPVPQPVAGTLQVTYTDTGADAPQGTIAVTSAQLTNIQHLGPPTGGFLYTATWNLASTSQLPVGFGFNYTPGTNANFIAPVSWAVTSVVNSTQLIAQFLTVLAIPGFNIGDTTTGGTVNVGTAPPHLDTTQQTALYRMPTIVGSPAILPVSYNNSNIVALFPADPRPNPDGGGGGGSGGGGGTGGGGSTGGGGTASGGIAGNLSFLPLMVQFTNRVAMALGNGFPPQLYSDPVTSVNPATVAAISAISVDAFGVVTVTTSTPHGLSASQVGANVLIAGVTNALYNGAFPTISIVSPTQYKVFNAAAIGQAPSSGGTSTTTTIPITSSFVPAFPTWSATTAYSTNSIVQPSPTNGHFYKAVQGGTSGGAQPTFPTVTGNQVSDGSVIWQEAGATNTAAPPPPGAGHIYVYAGSLWAWNTSPTNTSTGLDGPCSLRMSDVNNPTSWNPLNQAFLDKDDGTEGTGLSSLTITAQGIPPEGSLIVFKNFNTYQIVGVFGSPNLTIQRVKTDMGCFAPRSIQFVPGFGLARFTHLGFAIFDGVEDRVTSEDIRPYLFPTQDQPETDITALDASWQAVIWGFQTASPPMYCSAIPIGSSGGQLTRIMCYDMVLKAWAIVDLPFPIGTAAQFRTPSANPVTVFGGFSDGVLSRWQAGDQLWDVGATGIRTPTQIAWSVRLPEALAQNADNKLNCRRLAIRGINTSAPSPITVTTRINGVSKWSQTYRIPASGDFEVYASFMRDGLRFSAIIAGNGQLELDRFTFHISQKEVGIAPVIA